MKSAKGKSAFNIAVICVLVIEAFVLSGIIVYLVYDRNLSSGGDTALSYNYSEYGKYVMYIGLNDKDTYTQKIPTEEAKDTVNDICAKYVDGYTVSEANGGWVDEKGILTDETSLVYTFSEAMESDIISIMDEVLDVLNQNSILIERQDVFYVYYDGN